MKRIRDFLKTSLLGGLVVILPVAILIFVFKWIFGLVTNMVQPLTNLVMARSQMQEILADILVIAVILSLCFVIGVFVRTRLGKWIFKTLENKILKIAPGYSLIKETVMQFLGGKKSPFSSVALVQIFANETLASAFVTDTHEDGSYTVFVPTGPNPTSGNIYHLAARFVHPVDVPVEDAMRSIISCGAGSTKLIKALSKSS
ncbi:MAG: DUF502 domain-containing protein [Candidatus Binatia bacterium]